jgi:uncharacterized protein YdhG (YjbR/CyaY superfamily)
MKQTKIAGRGSAAKKSTSAEDVDKYLAAIPEPARATLSTVRALIRSAAPPEATECISYGIPTFKYNGALVAYAAFKNHCSFFPMGAALIRKFKKELAGYETAKGTIRFPVDKPLPSALIKKFVKARIAQNGERKRP